VYESTLVTIPAPGASSHTGRFAASGRVRERDSVIEQLVDRSRAKACRAPRDARETSPGRREPLCETLPSVGDAETLRFVICAERPIISDPRAYQRSSTFFLGFS